MTRQTFDKPFKDFPGLIELLKSRGLNIRNEETAINLLKIYGYYPVINGFKKSFQTDFNEEKYQPNVQIEQLFSEFILDSQFQEILLTSIFPIENHFKNMLGYLISKNFGVNNFETNDANNPDNTVLSYLDPSNYHNSGRVKALDTMNFIKANVLTSSDDPVAYYRKNKNHVPAWILCQNMMFGTSVKLFQILPSNLKEALTNEMILPIDNENITAKKELLLLELEILRKFRNSAAHSSPVYLLHVDQSSDPSVKLLKRYLGEQILTREEGRQGIGTRNLYAALIGILLLTRNSGQRTNTIQQIKRLRDTYMQNHNDTSFDAYNHYIRIAQLPTDYVERLERASMILSN